MSEDLQRAFYMFAGLFAGMPPAVFVLVSLLLFALTLYAGYHALHSVRIVVAVASAPLTDLNSRTSGLAKLRGTAQPASAPARSSPSSVVWYSRTHREGSKSSTLTTTDNFLIEDGYGRCAVDVAKAVIVPSQSESTHAFLDKSRVTDEKVIRAGDPVFALGELKFGLPPLADIPTVQCQLAKIGGVMVVSGDSEKNVKVLYSLYVLVLAPLTLLCTGALAFGIFIHLGSYPPSKGSVIKTFIESLRETPWESDPGLERQLRDETGTNPNP